MMLRAARSGRGEGCREPVRRPGKGWKAAAGILVASGVLIATVAIVRVAPQAPDPVRASRRIASATSLSSSDRGVLILATEANRRCLRAEGADLDERLDRWEDALAALDVPVRRVADLHSWGDEILLLVNVVCLSDEDLAVIEERMLAGAGVFVAGGIGTRDEEGRWLGWERMHEFLGSLGRRDLAPGEDAWMTTAPDLPPNAAIEPGMRFRSGGGRNSMALSGLPSAAMWDNSVTRSGADPGAELRSEDPASAAATASRGRGRLAWSGVDPGPRRPPLEGGIEQDADRLLDGLLDWCAGGAEARIDLWPGGAEAVLLVICETDRQAGNAAFLDRALEQIGSSGTYPFSGDRAARHAPLVRDLASRHAIVLRGDGRGEFAGAPYGRQLARLRAAGRDLARAAGRPIRGACPPGDGWDATTLQALASLGYRYVLERAPAHDALPEPLEFEDARGRRLLLLRIPAAGIDDRDLIASRGADEGVILRDLLDGLRAAARVHGIDALSVHADALGSPDRIDPLVRFLEHASMSHVWITSADSLAAWWSVRSKMSLSLRREGDTYVLDIENGSEEASSGCDLLVCLPGAPEAIDVEEADRVGGPDERGIHRLRVGRIERRAHARILLRVPAS